MNINLNLQPVMNLGSGIAMFENQLINELVKNSNYDLFGCFNFIRGVKPIDLQHFPFKVNYSNIPSKLVYSRSIQKSLPIYYHNMMKNCADVNLFFTYKIPRVKYKGVTISTIHDLIPLRVLTENKRIEVNYKNDIEYAICHSDYLITVSETSKEDIISEFDYDEKKIFVIPNGVDYDLFNANIDSTSLLRICEKYNLPSKFILYFGGIRKHKNVESLIKAYSLLSSEIRSEVSLVITHAHRDKELDLLVKKLKLEQQVFFTSFIDEVDKPAVYKLALVVVFISLCEGFGLPIIEAMAAGTPVVTSNISSMPEIAGNAAILVHPLDLVEIATSIENVIMNKELGSRLIDLGYDNAKKYSWKNSGEKLMKLCANFN